MPIRAITWEINQHSIKSFNSNFNCTQIHRYCMFKTAFPSLQRASGNSFQWRMNTYFSKKSIGSFRSDRPENCNRTEGIFVMGKVWAKFGRRWRRRIAYSWKCHRRCYCKRAAGKLQILWSWSASLKQRFRSQNWSCSKWCDITLNVNPHQDKIDTTERRKSSLNDTSATGLKGGRDKFHSLDFLNKIKSENMNKKSVRNEQNSTSRCRGNGVWIDASQIESFQKKMPDLQMTWEFKMKVWEQTLERLVRKSVRKREWENGKEEKRKKQTKTLRDRETRYLSRYWTVKK